MSSGLTPLSIVHCNLPLLNEYYSIWSQPPELWELEVQEVLGENEFLFLLYKCKSFFIFFYFTSWHPNLSHYIIIMRMNHKPQKSDLELLSLFFSPKRGKNLRDSLRKLDASKDKGRVFGGVSHFVLRVRNLSDLISRSVIWLTPSAHYYKQRRNNEKTN